MGLNKRGGRKIVLKPLNSLISPSVTNWEIVIFRTLRRLLPTGKIIFSSIEWTKSLDISIYSLNKIGQKIQMWKINKRGGGVKITAIKEAISGFVRLNGKLGPKRKMGCKL